MQGGGTMGEAVPQEREAEAGRGGAGVRTGEEVVAAVGRGSQAEG